MFFAIVIMLSGFGCSFPRLYEGEKLPKDKVSKLYNGNKVRVQSIDGITDARIKGWRMELLPGTHSIEVSFAGKGYTSDGQYYGLLNSIAPHSCTCESQAGHLYELSIDVNTEKMEWSCVIKDMTNYRAWEVDNVPANSVVYKATPSPVVFKAQRAAQGGEVFREIEYMNNLTHTYRPR